MFKKNVYSNSPEFNTEPKYGINSVTGFDEKHSDSVKLKAYSYWLTCELYEYVKKLSEFDSFMPNSFTELMVYYDAVLNSVELLY